MYCIPYKQPISISNLKMSFHHAQLKIGLLEDHNPKHITKKCFRYITKQYLNYEYLKYCNKE